MEKIILKGHKGIGGVAEGEALVQQECPQLHIRRGRHMGNADEREGHQQDRDA